MLFCLCYWKR